MKQSVNDLHNRIPIAVSLDPGFTQADQRLASPAGRLPCILRRFVPADEKYHHDRKNLPPGVTTPHTCEPDVLNNLKVRQVLEEDAVIISLLASIAEAREWLFKNPQQQQNFYVVADKEGVFKSILSASNLFSLHYPGDTTIESFIKRRPFTISSEVRLKTAVEVMAKENLDVLPDRGAEDNKIMGVLSYRDILAVYRHRLEERQEGVAISVKRRTLKILLHGKKVSRFENNIGRITMPPVNTP